MIAQVQLVFVSVAALVAVVAGLGKNYKGLSLNSNGASAQPVCSSLYDHGAYYTVDVEVGTPGEKFAMVADTGSDQLIVPSCDTGMMTCFSGARGSSTFTHPKKDIYLTMEFGSGAVTAAITSDVVRVGGISASMTEGLLMMIDSALDIEEPLEGILGLGPPHQNDSTRDKTLPLMPTFLEAASVPRFSMCLNAGGSQPGVLRLDTAPQKQSIGSVGNMHWGLEFHGISVGQSTAPVTFCSPSKMKPGQLAPCGFVPDSGTTSILGPADQVTSLFENICDEWPRCAAAAKAVNKQQTKEDVFQSLLLDCTSWLTHIGLDELPTIHFHVVGEKGKGQILELTGWAYVFQTEAAQVLESRTPGNKAKKPISLFSEVADGLYDGNSSVNSSRDVCVAAFGSTDYVTASHGPVWVVGLPLFYEYRVSYDLSSSPPSMAFTNDEPCGSCSGEESLAILMPEASAYSSDGDTVSSRAPRRSSSPPRVPKRWASGSGKKGDLRPF